MEKKTNKKRNGGTREWAATTVNCCTGCTHNCRYCYARDNAVRYKQLTADQWPNERIRQHDVDRGRRKRSQEWVMFPSSHDITPTNLAGCMVFLEKLLRVGNQVLIVSKPHIDCIKAICKKFGDYQGQILFRFTIGACDDSVLSFWEPGAPEYAERKASLEHAFRKSFQTSVSVEPMLDSANIDNLVADLMPYVTESIWIGKMNHIDSIAKYVDEPTQRALVQIDSRQSDAIIKFIYARHKNNPMIKWKESIRAVVGI